MANHAVDNGVLQSVSPSQVNTFRMCQRRWRLAKVERIPEPERGEAATAGENEHRQLEHYLDHDTAPTSPALLALIADPGFPARGPAVQSEVPRDYDLGLTADGVPVKGKIDMVVNAGESEVAILDLKSKSVSAFRKLLKPEQLRKDVQALVYSEHIFTKYPQTEAVSFTHAYVQRGDEAKHKLVSSGLMTRQDVRSGYENEFEATVREMKAVAALPTWQDAEPTWSACRLYPPLMCPYKSMCEEAKNSVSVSQAFADMFAGEESGT